MFCELSPYHGYWKEMDGGGLYLHFNGRGLGGWPDGTELRLYVVYVRLSTESKQIYIGKDHNNRDVKLEHYGTWTVADTGHFVQSADDSNVGGKRWRSED